MASTLIWDIPTRLFHWLFAVGFLAAAAISLTVDGEGPLFAYHAIIGLALAALLVLRLAWGLVGSRYARLGELVFGPGRLVEYAKGVLIGGGKRYVGHNPGSAYAIVAMFVLLGALAVTGVMLGTGNEGVKEVHEFCAYAMLAVVAVHILGVIVHSARHRENITASMIHGRKHAEPGDGIPSSHAIAGALLLLITGVWTLELVRSYSPSTQAVTIPLFGTSLQIGEAEHEGEHRRDREHEDDD
ncbi:MAG: cytochrome b/b6 domain-containing protein [Phycisphaerales bacterium]|nr:cytochrome b/b6 domain-containing protein [Phycisphaerales bacterium]